MPVAFFIYALCLLTLSFSTSAAQVIKHITNDVRVAVVYDRPNKFDHSFNQAVYENGVLPLRARGIEVKEFEPANSAQTEQGIMKLARRGFQPIIGIGYATAPAIAKAAQRYPQTAFIIVDSEIALANVQSITFQEDQGAYLAGVLAALTTKSNKIGFIGGMDIPLIAKFSCGYLLGAKSISPDIIYYENYVGSTLNAWNDPSKGLELAVYQFERGADVIFSAAGGTGLGVFQAAQDHHKFAIGVDSNQNALQPGAVLSSMVKRVGKAIYDNVLAFKHGKWQPGAVKYGLAGGWIDLARDQYNKKAYTTDIYNQINIIKQQIISNNHPDINRLQRCEEELR